MGGELFEKISKMKDYSEPYAAKIMKQLFYIIVQLHRVDVIHQDLKPENLLLLGEDSSLLKRCDFGLAEIADDETELFGCVGSTTYMAPEVVNESGHHKPVDVYAAGVIMYIMLCGYPPFEPENGIIELEFPDREWEEISIPAKELIVLLLDKDSTHRPTAEEALQHMWFKDVETIRNPKTLARAVNILKKYQESGPGSMNVYRGARVPVFGVFENPPDIIPSTTSTSTTTTTTVSMKPLPEKMDTKPIPPLKDLKLPDLPLPPTLHSPKKGAKTDRTEKEKKGDKKSLLEKKKQQSLENKEKKRKKDRKKRASAPNIKQAGILDFDPRGPFKEKKGYQELIDSANISQKKKENRKSVRTSNKSEREQKKKNSIKDLSGLVEDPNILSGAGPIIDEIVHSLQKELNYQNELLDYMKEECILLRRKIQDETEKCSSIMEQFDQEIVAARKVTEEERKERRQVQFIFENLQATITSQPASPTMKVNNPKNTKPQNSKTKPTQKKKKTPN